MRLLKAIARVVSPRTQEPHVVEMNEIRAELIQVRTQLRYLGRIYDTVEVDYQEAVAHEINGLQEKEHALIKHAKRIAGDRINIPTSLREYREA